MKDKDKELFIEKAIDVIRFLLCTTVYVGIFLFVVMTGVSVLPIIYNNNPFASQVYAYAILIVSVLVVYKWIEILTGDGEGIV